MRRRIKLGTFAALDQRIALRYAMAGMEPAETNTYLTHHLKLAGRSDTLFSDDATTLIHQVSRGLPRAVNNLAVQSLVAAYATNKTIVDESSARAAVTEVTPSTGASPNRWNDSDGLQPSSCDLTCEVPSPPAGNTVAHANRVHPPTPDDDAAGRWIVTERRGDTPATSAELLG